MASASTSTSAIATTDIDALLDELISKKKAGEEIPYRVLRRLQSKIGFLTSDLLSRDELAKMGKSQRRRFFQRKRRAKNKEIVAAAGIEKKRRREIREMNSGKREKEKEKGAEVAEGSKDEESSTVIDESEKKRPRIKTKTLSIARNCTKCKKKYRELHHFYHHHCLDCAELFYSKRTATANLKGKIALVTGGRIKIGYETVLLLLRAGATVIVTTRFPADALLRYRDEADYKEFRERLHLFGCDFLSLSQVDGLVAYLKTNFPRLDILINNACQTLHRPAAFYKKELELPLIEDAQVHYQTTGDRALPSLLPQGPALPSRLKDTETDASVGTATASVSASSTVMIIEPAPSSLMELVATGPGADEIDHSVKDEFGQPTDRRKHNTWVTRVEDLSFGEVAATSIINSMVPLRLIQQLKPMMLGSEEPCFIVNVSSMEGVFNRHYKSSNHVHTNMAKASLNMIARTLGDQFAKEGIYMTSVDTGWITNENPSHTKKILIPLDCVDGAARVVDPIFTGVSGGELYHSVFLKDFQIRTV